MDDIFIRNPLLVIFVFSLIIISVQKRVCYCLASLQIEQIYGPSCRQITLAQHWGNGWPSAGSLEVGPTSSSNTQPMYCHLGYILPMFKYEIDSDNGSVRNNVRPTWEQRWGNCYFYEMFPMHPRVQLVLNFWTFFSLNTSFSRHLSADIFQQAGNLRTLKLKVFFIQKKVYDQTTST